MFARERKTLDNFTYIWDMQKIKEYVLISEKLCLICVTELKSKLSRGSGVKGEGHRDVVEEY